MNIRQLLACLNICIFAPELERPLQSAARRNGAAESAARKVLKAVLCAAAVYGTAILYKDNPDNGIKLICLLSLIGTAGTLFPPRHFSHGFYIALSFALPVFETADAVGRLFGSTFAADSVLPEAATVIQALALLIVLWRDMDLKEKTLAALLFCSMFALFRFPGTGAANAAVVFSTAFFTNAAAAGISAAVLFCLSFFAALLSASLPLDAAAAAALLIGAAAKLASRKIGGNK